jgi:riboflavin-specific deaminase-like protein
MAEPSQRLWSVLLKLVATPRDQSFKWRSEDGKASLGRPARGSAELDGAWSPVDRRAFALFQPLLQDRDLAIAQLGQSLDGRIATASGDSYYINGRPMRAHLHRLRALVDAVVVGAGTAVADRPALTVRHCQGADPVPVIIDPAARVPCRGPLFDPAVTPRLILVHARSTDRDDWPAHVEALRLASSRATQPAALDPGAILAALAELGLRRVLIEGGGVTVSRFIDAQALDRLHLLIAPLLIGSGPSGLNLRPIERLSEADRRTMRSFPLADELVVDLDLSGAA